MILAKTHLRRVPRCCGACPYYDSMGNRARKYNDGVCRLTYFSTSQIIISKQRLKKCPLIEMEE